MSAGFLFFFFLFSQGDVNAITLDCALVAAVMTVPTGRPALDRHFLFCSRSDSKKLRLISFFYLFFSLIKIRSKMTSPCVKMRNKNNRSASFVCKVNHVPAECNIRSRLAGQVERDLPVQFLLGNLFEKFSFSLAHRWNHLLETVSFFLFSSECGISSQNGRTAAAAAATATRMPYTV